MHPTVDNATQCLIFHNNEHAFWWHLQTHTDFFQRQTLASNLSDSSIIVDTTTAPLPLGVTIPNIQYVNSTNIISIENIVNVTTTTSPLLDETTSGTDGGYSLESMFLEWNCDVNDFKNWYENTSFSLGLIIAVIWAVLGLFGLIANALILYILFYYKNWHKTSNIYLFYLAVADFTVLITFFLKLYENKESDYKLGSALCGVSITIDLCSQLLSGWMLILIALDRCFMVFSSSLQRFRTTVWANGLCLTSLVLCSPIFAIEITNGCICQYFISYGLLLDTCQKCDNFGNTAFNKFYSEYFLHFVSFVHFGMTIIMMLVCYLIVISQIRKVSQVTGNLNAKKYEIMVTKRSIALISTFLICWMPYYILRYVMSYNKCYYFKNWYQPLHMFCLVLSYSPAIINPFLYAGMSDEFKTLLMRRFAREAEDTETIPINTRETNLTLNTGMTNGTRMQTIGSSTNLISK